MPYSKVDSMLSNEQREEMSKKGFIFLEMEFNNDGNKVTLMEMRTILDNNNFNYIPPRRKVSTQRQTYSSGKECPVCQMDEWCGTDGCPMDPQ